MLVVLKQRIRTERACLGNWSSRKPVPSTDEMPGHSYYFIQTFRWITEKERTHNYRKRKNTSE